MKAIVEGLYGQQVPDKMVQLQQTRPEFEGQVTLVVFPFTKMSHKAPEATGQEIGERLMQGLPEVISGFNVVKGFLLADAVGGKSVRGDDVCPCLDVKAMNICDDFGCCQA